jgi:hypothetical protein
MRNESIETKALKSLNQKNALLERYKTFTDIELGQLQSALLYSPSVEPIVSKVVREIEDVFQIREDRSVELEEQGE